MIGGKVLAGFEYAITNRAVAAVDESSIDGVSSDSDDANGGGSYNSGSSGNWDSSDDSTDKQTEVDRSILKENPERDFDDIAGLEAVKENIRSYILDPIRNPAVYEERNLDGVTGVLLTGPTGCGKTYLAHGIAAELDRPLFELSPNQLFGAREEDPTEMFSETFTRARTAQPSVLCLDALGEYASESAALSSTELVARLVLELETIAEEDVVVVGTVIDVADLDDAVRHAGVFDELIEVPPPTAQTRRAILEAELPETEIAAGIDWDRVVDETAGFAAVDLQQIAERGARRAIGTGEDIDTDQLLAVVAQTEPSIDASESETTNSE